MQVVRAFAREPYEMEKFDTANRDYMLTTVAHGALLGHVLAGVGLPVAAAPRSPSLGGPMVIRGELTLACWSPSAAMW